MLKIPPPLVRRDILYSKAPAASVLQEYGELYLREGRPNDAVEFFGQAAYTQGLRHICAVAIDEGDFFLFSRAKEFLHEAASPEELKQLGANAMKQEKFQFALTCFEKSGDREAAAEARKKLDEPIQKKEAS
jgi:tetratricopeptide (TPR) repeat protein